MIQTMTLSKDAKLSESQIAEISSAAQRPVEFDEDCPELTKEQLMLFKKVKGTSHDFLKELCNV